MGIVRFLVTVSLDGFVAGPDQSVEDPMGVGGFDLHRWAFELEAWRRRMGQEGGVVNESTPFLEQHMAGYGSVVMGRNMFGGGPGPWPDDPPWNGWWGDDPPFHTQVFVLTHHTRDPIEMQGGTTFHFVTDGIEVALDRAKEAADGGDVVIGGGAQTINQYLAAGLVDGFQLHVVPIVMGRGERLFDGVGHTEFEQTGAVEAPGVTHLAYRAIRDREP